VEPKKLHLRFSLIASYADAPLSLARSPGKIVLTSLAPSGMNVPFSGFNSIIYDHFVPQMTMVFDKVLMNRVSLVGSLSFQVTEKH
jgi:hypothetical protein